MWHRLKSDIFFILIIVVLNCVVVSDYFYHGSKSANFDAIAHITTIAQFHKALSDGEFPVTWGDGFANYGLPIGTIAHQLPAYTGAFLTFFTHDPLLSFNLVYLITAVVSALLFYAFLKIHFSSESSLLATIFYSLAPYRIMNLYMRGAMPEFASAVWVPLLLIAIYQIGRKDRMLWYVVFAIGVLGLILTHPMMLIVYAPILGIWMLMNLRLQVKAWLNVVMAVFVALLLSSYYFLPLNVEVRYLYYGSMPNYYSRNQATTVDSFVNPVWKYNCVYRNDIFGRCQLPKAGVTESIIMLTLAGLGLLMLIKKKITLRGFSVVQAYWDTLSSSPSVIRLFWFAMAGASVSILFSSGALQPLYERIKVLSSIQYPWRFLSSYLFFPPIVLAMLFEFVHPRKWSKYLWYGLIFLIIILRFPQLYGKNYTHVPISDYYFTPYNLHSLTMNTIWSGDSRDYPIKRDKAEIIHGTGKIIKRILKNASRTYTIEANTEVRISDNTFYFPGWHVYIDGAETGIEFQDPTYRGVITFVVPQGNHTVRVVYEDTKVRIISKAITVTTLFCLGIATVFLLAKRKILRKD